MNLLDPRTARARDLRRMKLIALALLLSSVALLVLAHVMGRQGMWGWVGAYAEASMVGALADWFAVVALFRRPLGLPIPHTAIIPENKTRIATALADFVGNHFLAPKQIVARIEAWNPALALGAFFSRPAQVRNLSRQLQSWVHASLGALDAPALERALVSIARDQLSKWNAATTAAQLIRVLTEGNHHQRVLNTGLVQIGRWVDQTEVRGYISEKLSGMARREFPKMTWLVDKVHSTDEIADALSEKVANAIIDELQAVLNDPQHPLRARYGQEAAKLLARLEDDAELQGKVADFKQQLLESESVNDYVRHVWQRMRDWLKEDLASPNSVAMGYFESYATRIGVNLRDNVQWQNLANAQILIAAEHLAGALRKVAPDYIKETIESWDTRFLVNEIEQSVGVDLQFIRFNGTLIGGLVGLALYGLLQLPLFN
ncbi:DUF445 domain-containing protein [Lysobacter sp. HDW10]|uniref:DUF445 domain-containing protein n=1 Tax=Lysobacter sp. HDW10 TaxID=2714936 RepID=UPI00140A2133|nr:DUF445 domain-containing protein [Lysobacter sp. HDW10]QIK81711.1 DUF445 domain-containing protein [Lysobacter sp. HDW10]